jgi:broad specificity phosphatase PhoE
MLILVRHGESVLNAQGCLVGRLDPALTEVGQAQARAAGQVLDDVAHVIASPLTRAQETAALLGTGRAPVIDERVIEVDYGVLDGTPLNDVPAELWAKWIDDPHFAPEGGESLHELSERIEPLLEELFATDGQSARAPDGDVVIVSHVSPIKAAVAWVLQADPLLAWRMRLSNGSLTRIGWGPRGPQLVSFNEVPPLS